MSCHTFLKRKYESPSVETFDVVENTALLAASFDTSNIDPYTDDPNAIVL